MIHLFLFIFLSNTLVMSSQQNQPTSPVLERELETFQRSKTPPKTTSLSTASSLSDLECDYDMTGDVPEGENAILLPRTEDSSPETNQHFLQPISIVINSWCEYFQKNLPGIDLETAYCKALIKIYTNGHQQALLYLIRDGKINIIDQWSDKGRKGRWFNAAFLTATQNADTSDVLTLLSAIRDKQLAGHLTEETKKNIEVFLNKVVKLEQKKLEQKLQDKIRYLTTIAHLKKEIALQPHAPLPTRTSFELNEKVCDAIRSTVNFAVGDTFKKTETPK